MARIRTIKPEFWSSEQIMDLSPMARLLFIGLWNFCDDGGNHPASAKTLKAEVFPSDDITSTDVQRLLDELSSNSLIVTYSSNSKDFWHVNGWKHQKIDRPTFKHPPYIEGESDTTRRALDEASPPEGKGREGSKPSDESNVGGTRTPPTEIEPTRRGALSLELRKRGIDAAPHVMNSDAWTELLATRTDEEIIAVAEIAKAGKPGERISLNYLIPMLKDRAEPRLNGGNTHAKPQGNVAETVGRFTGRNREPEPSERVIEGTAARVDSAG